MGVTVSFAQQKVKDGTITTGNLPNKDAILELESNNEGFLHTRKQRLQNFYKQNNQLANNYIELQNNCQLLEQRQKEY